MTEREGQQSRAAVPQELTADVLDALIATAPIGIALVDSDLRFVRVNQHMAEINNLPAEAHLGRSIREVVPEAAELEAAVAQVLATGLPLPDLEIDSERSGRPGGRRSYRASCYPVRDRDGALVAVGTVVADITERRRTELALRESHNLLRAVMDSTSEAVFLKDLDGRYVLVNSAAARAIGRPIDQILGRTAADLLPPVFASLNEQHDRITLGSGTAQLFEEQMPGPHGPRVFLTSKAPYCDEAGAVTGIIGISRDITERKRSEERLRFLTEAETAMSGSLDYATTAQTVLDLIVPGLADWCALYTVDRSGALLRSVAPQAAQPQPFDLLAPHPGASAHPIVAALRGAGPLLVPELSGDALDAWGLDEARRADLAGCGPRSALVLPLRARERVLGALALLSAGRPYDEDDLRLTADLTRRAALALDNARLYRETQEAVRARDQFLSIAAHELKTPLTSLKGYVDLMVRRMDRGGAGDERERRALRVIGDQAQRLNRMITSLLDLTRIENGQLSIERAPLDLAALARRLVEEIRPTTDRHSLRLEGADAPVWVEGDELRLEQVLQNLIQNAIKYSPQGGDVGVLLERRGGRAALRVADQGVGIPTEALPLLFRRFYRAPNVERLLISGVGVGLFVVREIVTLHGGAIDVESVEGAGSAFTVTLPLREGEADEH